MSLLARLGGPAGLCGDCRHHELLPSPRSVFLRCGRAATDPEFPRYPVLPVRSCRGFEPLAAKSGPAPQADLADWGWTPERDGEAESLAASGLGVARIVSQGRGAVDLMTAQGLIRGRAAGSIRHRDTVGDAGVAVGDWVAFVPAATRTGRDEAVMVRSVLPRRSAFRRKVPGASSRVQVVAANVDFVWLLVSLAEPLRPRRLERFVAFARESGAEPWVLLSKADLATPEEVAVAVEQAREVARGVAGDLPVLVVSVRDPGGLDELRARLEPRRTYALVGPSGVGKSSLTNALLGSDGSVGSLATGAVDADGKGRHTTTRREIVRLAEGALLLDTPGMRELQPWDLSAGLDETFEDIVALAAQCRFTDCAHREEPGCAVRAAIDEGALDPERLDHHRRLSAEQSAVDRRREEHAKREGKRPGRDGDRERSKALRTRLRDKYDGGN